jgi:hypothetical protein
MVSQEAKDRTQREKEIMGEVAERLQVIVDKIQCFEGASI